MDAWRTFVDSLPPGLRQSCDPVAINDDMFGGTLVTDGRTEIDLTKLEEIASKTGMTVHVHKPKAANRRIYFHVAFDTSGEVFTPSEEREDEEEVDVGENSESAFETPAVQTFKKTLDKSCSLRSLLGLLRKKHGDNLRKAIMAPTTQSGAKILLYVIVNKDSDTRTTTSVTSREVVGRLWSFLKTLFNVACTIAFCIGIASYAFSLIDYYNPDDDAS